MRVRLIRGVPFLLLLVALAACLGTTNPAPPDLTAITSGPVSTETPAPAVTPAVTPAPSYTPSASAGPTGFPPTPTSTPSELPLPLLLREIDVKDESGGAVGVVDLDLDPARGHVYVTDTSGRLHILDSDTGEQVATLIGGGQVAVDSPHGRFYTGGPEPGGAAEYNVRVFDADRLEMIGEIDVRAKPVADPTSGLLYLVNRGVYIASAETLTVTGTISGTVCQVEQCPSAVGAIDAAVDPGSGRVFTSMYTCCGFKSTAAVGVREPGTYELLPFSLGEVFADVDPLTGRAYLYSATMGWGSLHVVDVAGGGQTLAQVDMLFGPLRTDPVLGRAYLSRRGTLFVLDAADLELLGAVPAPGGFAVRAVDAQRHLLYLVGEISPGSRVQVWAATGGGPPAPVEPVLAGLPADQAHSLFQVAADGSLYAGSLYRSDDKGNSWHSLGTGLPQQPGIVPQEGWLHKLVVAPGPWPNQVLFAAMGSGTGALGLWKSTDGGQSWRLANRGIDSLAIGDLALSPGFASDHTLLASASTGLFRSTDGGETWVPLTVRSRPAGYSGVGSAGLAVSPTYGRDRTLFAVLSGVQRSTDGGKTWTEVLPDTLSSLVVSPAFADDHTLFGCLGESVLRSTDGGDTWQAVSQGLVLHGAGIARLILAPDYATSRTLYFVYESYQEPPLELFRSTDGGESWQWLPGGAPRPSSPIQLSPDGSEMEALDEDGRLVRWRVGELGWQPSAVPPLAEVQVSHLVLSRNFADDHTLLAETGLAGILRSVDGGLTWTDTGFPFRPWMSGAEPVEVGSDTFLVGTPLGLYRLTGAGPWTPVDGGLPPGVDAAGPQVGSDGSLAVLVGSLVAEQPQRVFLSTDGGLNWTQALPDAPYHWSWDNLQLSPTFLADRMAFHAAWTESPQRTIGGGAWQAFGPPGRWSVWSLSISPTLDRDGLLLVSVDDGSLWRSTDRGDTWTPIDIPWGAAQPSYLEPAPGWIHRPATFSTAYAQDGVILSHAGEAIYRSTDGGVTWVSVLQMPPESGAEFAQAAFVPDYARSGTIFLLQGRHLYCSVNRGQTWEALPPGPWSDQEQLQLLLSPNFGQDQTLLAHPRFVDAFYEGSLFESTDGGQTWEDIGAGLPVLRQVMFSPDYATDGLVFVVGFDAGLYKRIGDGGWVPISASVP